MKPAAILSSSHACLNTTGFILNEVLQDSYVVDSFCFSFISHRWRISRNKVGDDMWFNPCFLLVKARQKQYIRIRQQNTTEFGRNNVWFLSCWPCITTTNGSIPSQAWSCVRYCFCICICIGFDVWSTWIILRVHLLGRLKLKSLRPNSNVHTTQHRSRSMPRCNFVKYCEHFFCWKKQKSEKETCWGDLTLGQGVPWCT